MILREPEKKPTGTTRKHNQGNSQVHTAKPPGSRANGLKYKQGWLYKLDWIQVCSN